jgi:hypothetical protein
MFTEALKKHEEYSKRRRFAKNGGYSAYDAEIGKKIAQLNWLISKAQVLNAKVVADISTVNMVNAVYQEALWELEITAESFYYFVGRLVEIFKHNPRFCNIPSSNAERVRHQLLQHPEKQKDRQKASSAFGWGSVDGPKIKSYRGPEGALEDNGLFENAREFNLRLVHVFDKEATET